MLLSAEIEPSTFPCPYHPNCPKTISHKFDTMWGSLNVQYCTVCRAVLRIRSRPEPFVLAGAGLPNSTFNCLKTNQAFEAKYRNKIGPGVGARGTQKTQSWSKKISSATPILRPYTIQILAQAVTEL